MGNKKNNDDVPAEENEGQVLGYFAPKSDAGARAPVKKSKTSPAELKAFKQDFYNTLDGKDEGVMTRHLFHEPPKNEESGESATRPGQKKSEIYGTLDKHFGRFLYGANAWHELVEKTKTYDGVTNDNKALAYAIDHGLADLIPGVKHIVEYGPGDKSGVAKSKRVIEAFNASAKGNVERYVAVDINGAYAIDAAKIIHEAFDIRVDAVQCDFMAAKRIHIPSMPEHKSVKNPVSVSFVFGGTLANAPDYSANGGKNSAENAVVYLSRMTQQEGIGSYIVLTYDAENDPEKLLNQYQSSEAFNAFVLSAITRAVGEGVITDDSYDPFSYWEMKPAYDKNSKTVRLCAVSKEDHVMPTQRGPQKIEQGKTLTNILSHKWNSADYRPLFKAAGAEIIADIRDPDAAHGVIVARVISVPLPASSVLSPK